MIRCYFPWQIVSITPEMQPCTRSPGDEFEDRYNYIGGWITICIAWKQCCVVLLNYAPLGTRVQHVLRADLTALAHSRYHQIIYIICSLSPRLPRLCLDIRKAPLWHVCSVQVLDVYHAEEARLNIKLPER